MTRLDWFEASPGAAKALGGLHHFVTTGTNLPPQLIHLVFLRASQINDARTASISIRET